MCKSLSYILALQLGPPKPKFLAPPLVVCMIHGMIVGQLSLSMIVLDTLKSNSTAQGLISKRDFWDKKCFSKKKNQSANDYGFFFFFFFEKKKTNDFD